MQINTVAQIQEVVAETIEKMMGTKEILALLCLSFFRSTKGLCMGGDEA